MSSHYPPLSCKEVKDILKKLGFAPRPRTSTSHEQWIKDENGRRYKVTVDCPKEPFHQSLIKYMAQQAGISKKEFYRVLNN